ncbi:phosphoglycerate dehydrogenase [Archaeoglobus veneficus]|uniref:D-3-phosphoglycerate dehydrogenase n=1 Tax=Archaeoglobus veneficus (strain DSM 11195 / SNP6) TaxID=693661 RepID=F2KPC4_ARCVS|nr:phosphoglycerate dehydrogenase [Archaeoglobus veneficus]AEA47528.1 D-3-phosphoglycerate dehydrogenase [Archaeoglobus veneficus SNP6]
MKVLVTDPIPDEAIQRMRSEGLEVDVRTGISEDELVSIIPEYEALVVRSGTKVTRRVIEAAKKLRIIGRAGVGVDNIDVQAATQHGIIVVNAPGGNSVSTAEHTLALILAVARRIPQADRSVKEGRWERKKFIGMELRGKTIGVIGLGKVGFEVAKRAKALEMNVLAYDPYISEERAKEIGAKLVDLDELLKSSDIVTIHVPKTKETEGLISREKIAIMKDGAYLINCARGGLVDEKALYDALKEGKLAGAALDVYEKEPPDANNPLFTLENVVTTPHLGASTKEAQISVGMTVANEIINMAKGLPVRNAVNLPSMDAREYEYIMPYLKLAEKMGRLAASRLRAVRSVRITFRGRLAEVKTEFVTRALLKGLLEGIVSNINLVSALPVARERGIAIEETRGDVESYESLLEAEISNGERSISIAGTCFGSEYRIVRIDRYKVDFVPEGHYVISLHEDKPGVIGRVGTLFGKHNINIAGMLVGRYGGRGGVQLMLLLVDDPPSDEVLDEMVKLDGIIDAVYVHL